MTIKEQMQIATVRSRLRDYSAADAKRELELLVSEWRSVHPQAAAESSSWLKPLIPMAGYAKRNPDEPDEQWHNDTYTVTVRRHKEDRVFGSSKGGMVQLGIGSIDGTARHDWRDFQAIKNQLAGQECEAFELYPAESRLLDPSNYYTLWCFPGVKRIKVGIEERVVRDADEAIAPQRKLPGLSALIAAEPTL